MKKNNMKHETIGQRIYFLRNKYGISLQDLAIAAEIPEETLKKYEKGILSHVPFVQIEKLAPVLHTSSGYLLYGEAGTYDELNMAGNHMSVEENLFDGCMEADDEAMEVFWAMAEKTPEQRDDIMDSGSFNNHIEGYLTLTLRYIGYPESEINNIRSTLRHKIFNHVTAETARKTGEFIGIIRKPNKETKSISQNLDTAVVYPFPFNKKDFGK